jgi:hypothetical protein
MDTGRLKMFWRNDDASGLPWLEGEEFSANIGNTPPVMIESNHVTINEFGIDNFELLVAVNGQVQHWRRYNGNLATLQPPKGTGRSWGLAAVFGSNVRHVWSLLQGPYNRNMEAIVELNNGSLQHWWWNSATGLWGVGPPPSGVDEVMV